MKFVAIIPARYASSRFPGKLLATLGGIAVINRVVERVGQTGIRAVVATDDERILKCVVSAGGEAQMTRDNHLCGTDRVREVADRLDEDVDVIINVQGDEPFINPSQLNALMSLFKKYPDTEIATLARPLPPDTPFAELADPALVKAVIGENGEALYFSRFPIPYQRNLPEREWASHHTYLAHLGIYAYRREVLRRITDMPASPLELAESLEQLRWLQAGIKVRVALTDVKTIGIDTPADLKAAEDFLSDVK